MGDIECVTAIERFSVKSANVSKYLLFWEALNKSVSFVDTAVGVGFAMNNSVPAASAVVTTSKFSSLIISLVAKSEYASPEIEVGPPGIGGKEVVVVWKFMPEIEPKDVAA